MSEGRRRARRAAGRAHDRPRAGKRLQDHLPQTAQQRCGRPRPGDDAAPPYGRDVLGLGRPRLPDHGQLPADARFQPLGAGQAGADPGAGGAHGDIGAGKTVGATGPGLAAPGFRRRRDRLRPRHDRAAHARGGGTICPAAPGASSRPRTESGPPSSTAKSSCATTSIRAPSPVNYCGDPWRAIERRTVLRPPAGGPRTRLCGFFPCAGRILQASRHRCSALLTRAGVAPRRRSRPCRPRP